MAAAEQLERRRFIADEFSKRASATATVSPGELSRIGGVEFL
jgi:hypothetical protein